MCLSSKKKVVFKVISFDLMHPNQYERTHNRPILQSKEILEQKSFRNAPQLHYERLSFPFQNQFTASTILESFAVKGKP